MWAYEVSGKQVLWHWFSAQGDEHSGCIPAKYGRVRDVGKARRRHRSGPHSIRATIISAARVFSSGHRSAQASVKAPMSPWSRITGITPLHVRRAKNGSPSVHPMQGEEIRALRSLQREQGPSSHVFMTERDGPMTPKAFHALFGRIGTRAKMQFQIHPHMLRHGCGYALANAGHDTRALQAWLGHKNIQHTVRYTELAPYRFRSFWR